MASSPLEQFSVLSLSDFSLEPPVLGQQGVVSSILVYLIIVGLAGITNQMS